MSNEARFSPYQPPDTRSIGRPQHSGAGSTGERVRGSRRMGEMRALVEAVRGTVKTDKHVGARSQPYTGILPEAHPVPRKHPRLVVTHPSDR